MLEALKRSLKALEAEDGRSRKVIELYRAVIAPGGTGLFPPEQPWEVSEEASKLKEAASMIDGVVMWRYPIELWCAAPRTPSGWRGELRPRPAGALSLL